MFLKHMLSFHEMEHGPKIEIRTLFPIDFQFPEAELLGDTDLEKKLDTILEVFIRHNICLGLAKECPDRLVYQYIVNEVLRDQTPITYPEGMRHVFDGCDGCCEDCFQQAYCEAGRELL